MFGCPIFIKAFNLPMMWAPAAARLLFLSFLCSLTPRPTLGCKSAPEDSGPNCAKTHRFSRDMGSIFELGKEATVQDCRKKGLCATGKSDSVCTSEYIVEIGLVHIHPRPVQV